MKKTFKTLFTLLAIAGTAVSCAKNDISAPEPEVPVDPAQPAGELVTFEVSDKSDIVTPSEVDTKSYFANLDENNFAQIWSSNDKVSVFDANGTNVQFSNSKTSDDAKAIFEGTIVNKPSTYYILYPYQSTATISGNVITATMPDSQVASLDAPYKGTDPAATLGVAYSSAEDSAVDFKNCFSVLAFDITEEDITSVMIEGNNGEALAGTVKITVSDTPSFEVTDAKTSIVLTPAEGDVFATGSYAIAMLPVASLPNGLKIVYKHSGSAKCSIKNYKNTNSDLVLSRNKLADVAGKPFSEPNYKYYYLLTKSDLDAWKADKSNWAATDVVYLGADINYGHSTWGCENFEGTFNGRNHCIYGIHFETNSGRTGFFSTLTGTVKNVCFGSSDYNFTSGEGTYDAYSTIDHTSTSTSWNYAGAIAYCGNNGVIDNVVNFCPLNVSTDCSAGDTRVAGIAGTMKSDGTINNCVNFGDITINSTKFRAANNSSYDVAGIVSRTDGTGDTITNCTNHGNILSYNTYVANYGGVLGSLLNDSTISDLHNTGNITLAGSSQDTYLFIGGVIGNINLSTTQSTSIDNCSNAGNIVTPSVTSAATGKPSLGIGGVIGRIAGKSVAGLKNIDNDGSITNNIAGPESDTDGIRLGGLVGYAHQAVNSGVDADSKNTGAVTNNANTGNKAYFGGIVGYVSASCAVKAENTGAVTNNGTVGGTLYMAGIMAAGTSGATHTCINRGNVTNNGAVSGNSVYMGGVMGYNSGQYTFDTCYNYGDVINEGAAKECCIGGMSGIMDNRLNIKKCKVYTATIKNTAAITDTLSIGGLVGEYWRSRTSNTNQVAFNTNKVDGASYVTNTANVGVLCMGGQIGNHQGKDEPDGQASGYWKAECNATISNSGNTTKGNIYIGGITGLMARAPKSFGSSDNKNNFGGSISNTGTAPNEADVEGATDNFYVCIGGNIGSVERTTNGNLDPDVIFDIQYTSNSGSITVNSTTGTDAQLIVGGICGRVLPEFKVTYDGVSNSGNITITSFKNSADTPYFTYIGGVAGNSPLAYKNCTNTGNITIAEVSDKPQKIRCGGIGAYYNATDEGLEISGCTSECDITVGNCHSAFVGGIVGDHRRTSGCSVSNCTYKGTLRIEGTTQSAASEKGTSLGGIFGSNYNMTFNNCTVKADVSGPSNGNNGYGLLSGGIAGSADRTMTLGTGENICTVIAGSKCGSTTISTSSELTKDQLVGSRRSSYITISPFLTKGTTYQIVSE